MRSPLQRTAGLALVLVVATGATTRAAEPTNASAEPGLRISFTDQGVPQMALDGRRITHATFPEGYPQVTLIDKPIDLAFPHQGFGGGRNKLETVTTEKDRVFTAKYNAKTHELLYTYPWGAILRRYRVSPDRLDIDLTIRNTSNRVVERLAVPLLSLTLPGTALPSRVQEALFGQTKPGFKMVNFSGPVALPMEIGQHVLAAACAAESPSYMLSWDIPHKQLAALQKQRHLEDRARHGDPNAQAMADQNAEALGGKDLATASADWNLVLTLGGGQLVYHERYMDWLLRPGEQTHLTVSLRLGDAADPLACVKDVLQAYAKAHPMLLTWPDRRPIVRSFLGDHLPYQAPAGPEFVKPKITPDPDVRKRMLAHADQLIRDMRAIDAQGMIIWNIESNGTPRIHYVGEPNVTPYLSPQADAVADEFFRKIRDAGFRTGLCIRPSIIQIRQAKDGSYFHRQAYPRELDVVDTLDKEVKYAHKRWGCTLFYVDTNMVYAMPKDKAEQENWPQKKDGKFQVYSSLMNAEQWEELLRRNPDCLFLVEHSYPRYYTSQASYDQMDMGKMAGAGVTPAIIRKTWPRAFKMLTTGYPQTKYQGKTVRAFVNDDIVAVNTPVTRSAALINAARREAGYIKAGPSETVVNASPERLAAIVADSKASPADRYHALRRIQNEKLSLPPETLAALCASDELTLKLLAIGMLSRPEDVAAIPTLLLDMSHVANPLSAISLQAIQCIGTPAIKPLVEKIRTTKEYKPLAGAMRALGHIDSPKAMEALLDIATDTAMDSRRRSMAINALRPFASRPEVSSRLIPLLSEPSLCLPAASLLARAPTDARRKAVQQALAKEKAMDKPTAHRVQTLERILKSMREEKK